MSVPSAPTLSIHVLTYGGAHHRAVSGDFSPINVIGPIPQTMRSAFGGVGWAAPLAISLLMMRAVASTSLIFTGLPRLP